MNYTPLPGWADTHSSLREQEIRELTNNLPREAYQEGFHKAVDLIKAKYGELLGKRDFYTQFNDFLNQLDKY